VRELLGGLLAVATTTTGSISIATTTIGLLVE